MEGYRVLFKEKEKAILEKFEVREPKDDEVVVKVEFNLISSGTEKAFLQGLPNTGCKFPSNPGYSSVGYVVKLGTGVKDYSVGDRVFVAYGGHANYNVKSVTQVMKIPDEVSMERAVFMRLASFPLCAIRRARLELGESLVVVGLGMLGLLGVQIASIGGAYPVIAIGNREIRQQKAQEYGANYVFSPNEPLLTEKIMEITNNLTGIKGANVVIETSGSESGLVKSLEYTSKYARVMLSGCQREMTQPVDFYKYVHLRGVQMIGVHGQTRLPSNSAPGNWTARRDYRTVFNYMKEGKLTPEDMVSEYVSPDQITEVYDRLLFDREFPLGVIIDWR